MVKYKESDVKRQAHTLYLPNKFLQPFPTHHKGKSTIHYLLARRNLERTDIQYVGNVKDIRLLGVIYPSGRIVYIKVVKVKVIEEQVKFVTYHN
ncbi:hypothetical protein E5K21_002096 [Enterococcus faecalis]|nr:hypothetical protein [Enterococcus faecalis]